MSSQPQPQPQLQPQPQTIVLNEQNSVQILGQFVELAQQKGAFLLQEAEILKRAMDVLLLNAQDNDINPALAKNLLIQGVNKGQRHGSYSLQDAALLHKVVSFLSSTLPKEVPVETSATPVESVEKQDEIAFTSINEDDDLSDLAEPIPLRPKEV